MQNNPELLSSFLARFSIAVSRASRSFVIRSLASSYVFEAPEENLLLFLIAETALFFNVVIQN